MPKRYRFGNLGVKFRAVMCQGERMRLANWREAIEQSEPYVQRRQLTLQGAGHHTLSGHLKQCILVSTKLLRWAAVQVFRSWRRSRVLA